jgi:transposase
MEATGRYGEGLAEFLYGKGHKVSILNPAQIRFYSKSCLTRSKTDKVDSKLIAEFAGKHETKAWKPLSSERKKLKALERCLASFKQDKTQITNRLEQETDKDVQDLLKERIEFIEQQIEILEAKLKKLLTTTEEIKTSVALLESIPGIGITTAQTLLGELPDLSTFESAKQLSAYAGLNPSIRYR